MRLLWHQISSTRAISHQVAAGENEGSLRSDPESTVPPNGWQVSSLHDPMWWMAPPPLVVVERGYATLAAARWIMRAAFILFPRLTALDFIGVHDPVTRLRSMGFWPDLT
jgi:hypothetical protein